MAREYDTALLESVTVRRARMRESLLWGRARRQLATVDNLRRFAIGLVIAAVLCAGCVGWSYLQKILKQQNRQGAAAAATAVWPRPATGGWPRPRAAVRP